MSVGISLVTVIVASLKPMRLAGKIMPIEAIRYTGQNETKRKKRKGFIDLNLERLTSANLSRNKKRTVITIVSLGMIGILFVVVSTVFNCVDPQDIARQSIAEDFRLELETWSGDMMNPERDWRSLQQSNPLTPETIQQITALPGVEKVEPYVSISGELPTIKDSHSGEPLGITISSIREDQMDQVSEGISKGSATYQKLAAGNTLIAGGYLLRNYPDLPLGKPIDVTIFDGDDSYVKKMTIIAAGDFSESLARHNTLIAAKETIQELSKNNLVDGIDIKVKQDQLSKVKNCWRALRPKANFII